MKLNNKGFAITAVLYGLLIMFVILVSSYLLILSAKKNRLDNLLQDAEKVYNGKSTVESNENTGENTVGSNENTGESEEPTEYNILIRVVYNNNDNLISGAKINNTIQNNLTMSTTNHELTISSIDSGTSNSEFVGIFCDDGNVKTSYSIDDSQWRDIVYDIKIETVTENTNCSFKFR